MPDDRPTAALDAIRAENRSLETTSSPSWATVPKIRRVIAGSDRLLAAVDRVLLLAEVWDGDSAALREQFARDVHPALASGHKEANALQQRAAEMRAAALLGEDAEV
jgi:hypothetical protein